MELFYVLIVIVITLLYTFVKNHRPVYDINYITLYILLHNYYIIFYIK